MDFGFQRDAFLSPLDKRKSVGLNEMLPKELLEPASFRWIRATLA